MSTPFRSPPCTSRPASRLAPRLVLGLLALTCAPLALAQSFSTLEERMSQSQFRAAGLDKLSPDELAALNGWLQQHFNAMPHAPAEDRTGFRPDPGPQEAVHSRLNGEFRGWSGKTTFHLENGQVWQQVGSDQWAGVRLDNPAVSITPALFSSWKLKVEGYNTTTKVRRIR